MNNIVCIYKYTYDCRGILTVFVCAHKASTRAIQFARGCGDAPLRDLVGSHEVPPPTSLSTSTDITSSLLVHPKESVPAKPSSTTSMQKAAVLSFQTWAIRAPGIVGLMMGNKTPKRKNALSIVVGRDFEELMGSSAIKTFCAQETVFPLGIVMQGVDCNEADRQTAKALTSRLLEPGGLESAQCNCWCICAL